MIISTLTNPRHALIPRHKKIITNLLINHQLDTSLLFWQSHIRHLDPINPHAAVFYSHSGPIRPPHDFPTVIYGFRVRDHFAGLSGAFGYVLGACIQDSVGEALRSEGYGVDYDSLGVSLLVLESLRSIGSDSGVLHS